MKLYIADAFTEKIFGGNPAGVVLLEDGKDFPPEETMRKTAAELRYSETAFIRQLGEREFQIRYFTPAAEVDLCGHATIASFACLMDAGLAKNGESYINHTLAGNLHIEIRDGLVMMDMAPPRHIETIDDASALRELYEVMGLSYAPQEATDLSGRTIKLLPMIISTGLADIILPVSSRTELAAITPDFKRLSALSKKYDVVGVHAFTPSASIPGVMAHCRNFAPLYGIDEEAATGTASGALAYYLYETDLLESGTVAFIQGETMGRPSKILACIKKGEKSDDSEIPGDKNTADGESTSRENAVSVATTADSETPGIKGPASVENSADSKISLTEAPGARIQTGGSAAILAKGEIMLEKIYEK